MPKPSGSWWVGAAAALLIVTITAFHYLTHSHEVAFHNVYRRLYYLPIVLAAFAYGPRGALGAAALVSLAYTPHAFFMAHHDPAPTVDKVLEIVLYFSVGGLTGWLVARQRRAQQALERAVAARAALEKQLIRAGRLSALGQLTSGLAHEIRNPLASILGAAEAVSSEFGPEHRKHRMAQVLLKEIHRLERVVSDSLRFARPGEGAREPLDLAAVSAEVLELVSQRSSRVALTLRGLDAPAVVIGDRAQLAQVLLNVVLNALQAIEASPAAAGTIQLRLAAREVGGRPYRCLGVEDDGPGVLAEHLEDVFNPYFTTRPEGTGLGLSLSSRIIEDHGGFMDIESAPGRTVVWLCLPLVSPASKELT